MKPPALLPVAEPASIATAAPPTMPELSAYRPTAALLVLTGFNLFDYFDRYILAAVLPKAQPELGLKDDQAGLFITAFMLGYFLTSPIFAYLGDRLSRRWLIAAGVAVWSVGTLLSGHASGFVSLFLFRVLVGFGEASFGTISPAWIADLFPRVRRNNAITIFYLAIPVGSALGYVFGGYMAKYFGWRAAFWWAGYGGIALAAALLFLREPRRGASEPDGAVEANTHGPVGWAVYRELARFPRYVLLILGYVAQTFAMGAFSMWGPTYFVRVHHMEVDKADYFFSGAVAATGIVATLVGGFLATKWQKKTGFGYAAVLALGASAAVPLAFCSFTMADQHLAQASLVAAMFALLISTGPVNTLILETVPVAMRASSMAASIFLIHLLGDVWSGYYVGFLSENWWGLQRAMLRTLPLALLVSALFWSWLLLRTRRELSAAGFVGKTGRSMVSLGGVTTLSREA